VCAQRSRREESGSEAAIGFAEQVADRGRRTRIDGQKRGNGCGFGFRVWNGHVETGRSQLQCRPNSTGCRGKSQQATSMMPNLKSESPNRQPCANPSAAGAVQAST